MSRILITGGAGYIGSHTARLLAETGHQPFVIDNLSNGHEDFVRWGPLIKGNVGDVSLIRNVLAREKIEAVIHFAASAYVGESMSHPREYFDNNVVNTLNLMGALIDSNVKRIVFSSSCAVYGVPRIIPIDESHQIVPVNPYGESKHFIERALHWYGQAYGLRSVILRYFNAAGASSDGLLGELHSPETHLIPLVIDAALGVMPCARICGTDYETPDGTAVRDYVHVCDLASAHVAALHYLEGDTLTATFNIGTGVGHSVRDVVQAIERVAGIGIPVVDAERRPGDPPALVACAKRAETILRWRPMQSSLENIVESAWLWANRIRPNPQTT